MQIKKIYDFLDSEIHTDGQEKWDNSGFLIGDADNNINKIVLALDIGRHAVEYAKKIGAGLIISHHPVIFDPIKNIRKGTVYYELVQNNIAAFCFHTCLDVSEHGMNDILYNLFKEKFYLGEKKIFEITQPDGRGFGFTAESKFSDNINLNKAAKIAGEILNCDAVRFYDAGRKINKICIVSGSGASMLEDVYKAGVDTFITGDVKQDRWIAAQNLGINLIDCGHYYMENICLPYLHKILNEKYPELEIFEFNEPPYKTIII